MLQSVSVSEDTAAHGIPGEATVIGLAAGERIPGQVSRLASEARLGALLSVHRPSTWLCRIQFRRGVYLLFENGLILSQKEGARLKLFRVGRMRIRGVKTFLLAGDHGQAGCMTAQWSDGAILAQALTRWAVSHPWV